MRSQNVLLIVATAAIVAACDGLARIDNVELWLPPDAATEGDSSGSGSSSGTLTDSSSGSGSSGGSSSGSGSGSGSGGGADAGRDALADAADAADTSEAGSGIPLSCVPIGPGTSNCGSTSESCCTSLEVSGGTYNRTYTNAGFGPTGEADPATVSGFRLDKYEVTVGRFRQFVNAVLPPDGGAGWLPAAGSGKHTHLNNGQGLVNNNGKEGGFEPGWVASDDSNIAPTNSHLNCDPNFATWTNVAAGYETLPINCLNWWESYAFCIWDGGFLPSEAEWEYAAAGGSQEKEYPWGSTQPGTACPGAGCLYAIYNCDYPSGTGHCSSVTNIAPVGTATLGFGWWGQLDLGGNVWEWDLDSFADYKPCTDCAAFGTSADMVIRGGYYGGESSVFLPPTRSSTGRSNRPSGVGLRCARTP